MAARIEGLDRLKRKLAALPGAVRKEATAALLDAGEQIADGAKSRVATDTGELAGSINVRADDEGASVIVEATAAHAKFVEFGTRHTPARPFLLPAFEEARPQVVSAVAQAARRAIKNVAKS